MSLNEISLVIQNGRSSNMKRAATFDDKKPFCEMKSNGAARCQVQIPGKKNAAAVGSGL